MRFAEVLGYILIYGYLAFGLGFFMKRGLAAVKWNRSRGKRLPTVGIKDGISVNIDHLFHEQGIDQIEAGSR